MTRSVSIQRQPKNLSPCGRLKLDRLVWWEIGVLIVAGFGGLVNVMAGGGSIITVPIMMFLGVPGPSPTALTASQLSRNAAAIATYLKHGVPHAKLCSPLTLVAIPPAIIGAYLSTMLNNEQFEWMLAGVMVGFYC